MKTYTFSPDYGQRFYASLQHAVRTSFRKRGCNGLADRRFFLKALFYYSGFAGSYLLLLSPYSENLSVLFGAFLLCGLFTLGLVFNVAHDAAHQTLFRRASWNRIAYLCSFPLLGNNPYIWRTYHLRSHHVYTNIKDSDIDVVKNALLRLHPDQPLRPWHRFQHLYAPLLYLFYTLNFVLFRDLLALFNRSDRTVTVAFPLRQKVLYALGKLFYFGLMAGLPFLLHTHTFGWILLAFIGMHFLMSIVIILVLACNHQVDLVAHIQPQDEEALPHSWVHLQLITNLDYNAGSRMCNFLLGGFNAHTVHHLFPSVCHVHYPKMVRILRKVAADYGLRYNETTYGKALRSHFRFLKKMGHEAA